MLPGRWPSCHRLGPLAEPRRIVVKVDELSALMDALETQRAIATSRHSRKTRPSRRGDLSVSQKSPTSRRGNSSDSSARHPDIASGSAPTPLDRPRIGFNGSRSAAHQPGDGGSHWCYRSERRVRHQPQRNPA